MNKKRLYKADNGKICGVCKGLAEYFEIDPTIVRVGWALLVCCAGTGIVLYIICALIMPKKSEVMEQINEAKVKEKEKEK